jgi:hypothetical protein
VLVLSGCCLCFGHLSVVQQRVMQNDAAVFRSGETLQEDAEPFRHDSLLTRLVRLLPFARAACSCLAACDAE